jgi:steroid delta-isomerase-like uncharacterized protein
MSQENKAIARRFLQAFARGDASTLEQIVADDIRDHQAAPGARAGRQGLLDAVAMFRTGLPDLEISVVREVAEGDLVAVHGTAAGTHRGPMLGAPATGRRVTFPFIDLYRIAGGRIVEVWHVEDVAGLMGQLGLLSS